MVSRSILTGSGAVSSPVRHYPVRHYPVRHYKKYKVHAIWKFWKAG
jgi:hypothetical protein